MKGVDRKAAVAAYKERKAVAGIYAIRCLSTDERWIGRAPDLSTIQNRLWFTLRQGSFPHRALQMAWNEHGMSNFVFEEIERLEDEPLALIRDGLLKNRLAHWCQTLGAHPI
ncbi:hypothetical protein SAMN02745126_06471 [Enhydrobacter aerosaccus]|uniref:GIY-YIG nuclease family protein n=1 Tax=Enhydrobacter aerosaccus TaxID=225324 RepID=A0A1T4TLI2_9HYPH|nr:GIY-YIG nuclease family protein [Enhydrobacter aerosaccus]SKA41099.1 hypothetical protein SAMN02745126_06471 [Enhydrobacter aerosaccus]